MSGHMMSKIRDLLGKRKTDRVLSGNTIINLTLLYSKQFMEVGEDDIFYSE